jgi:hypothetical protein
MKALRIIAYIVGGLLVAVIALIAVGSYLGGDNTSSPGIIQSMSVGGKTVHFVNKGPGAYTASNEGDAILINGKPLDLSGGDEFTVEIAEDGTTSLRPGKP